MVIWSNAIIFISTALKFFITLMLFLLCLLSEMSVYCFWDIWTYKYWHWLPKSSISQGLNDAHAQTFVYISSYHVYLDRHNTQRHACNQEHGIWHCHMKPYVHIQGYTTRACNSISQSNFPWNSQIHTAAAATAWTSCSHLVLLSGYVGWLYGTKLSSDFSRWEQEVFKFASLSWSVLVKK